jgi:sRNA-binding regulator protein Hfq
MGSGMNAARWNRKTQYQQRHPTQRPNQQRTQQQKTNDYGGFDGSILGANCRFKLANGETLQGLVSAVSKYWYLINVDGQILIVNKAYVVSIMPVQSQNKKEVAGTLVDASVGGGGDYDRGKQ